MYFKLFTAVLFFSIIFLSERGWAESAVTVRVESGVCENSVLSMKGSGVLFSENGVTYVLSSEHVVLHSNGDYCHRIYLEDGKYVNAQLLVAEYGNGLALLKLDEVIPSPNLAALEPKGIENTMSVEVLGFPHSTGLLTRGNAGKILIARSTRQPFPLLDSVIELSEAHGEFGMSGGPVLDSDGTLVGILSHQYLKLVPGGKTVSQVFSKETNVLENGLVAIPGDEAIRWIRERLSDTALHSIFVRDPEEQLLAREAVYVGGLRFEMKKNSSSTPVGGGEGVGIGGGEGAGIGGGEGVGIGGDTSLFSGEIEISLDLNHATSFWPLSNVSAWHERTIRELRTQMKTVQILFLLDKTDGSPKKAGIYSLNQFFTALKRPNMHPVTQVASSQTSISKAEREIKSLGSNIEQLANTLLKQQRTSTAKVLLQEVVLVATLSASVEWRLIDLGYLESLTNLDKNKSGWKTLFTDYFDEAVILLEKLKQLESKLKEVSY